MVNSTKKLIILDRDGVINHDSDDYIKSPEEWEPIEGSLEAIAQLNKAGFTVAVATNQSGIGRGYYSLETLKEMHQKMQDLLANVGGRIDYIAFCPHAPDEGCTCRKPKPGMLLEIANYFSVKPESVVFVGDTATDRQAAFAAKMKFVLVKTGKGEQAFANDLDTNKHYLVYESLQDFVNNTL